MLYFVNNTKRNANPDYKYLKENRFQLNNKLNKVIA